MRHGDIERLNPRDAAMKNRIKFKETMDILAAPSISVLGDHDGVMNDELYDMVFKEQTT